ncbi:tRNA adenosine(34) deaminase TadA [Legionella taurinensis]|uniref:tRNA-specific adenosine deaminase n=1 Tax=Legionella taurinensis TaxID=70611 RepID=A0A3A5M006_9GAMM|nr:tRNA adenosine(34) deaminase TadA [Legionella taurinensis]PUT42586.1 tRNA adenosine(34) deaminase TadA [Legionella taurinensis]PUT46614.1 tRNA adenosine(34) deaminase TadA [Legionella taurinensis]PUT47263.1 tRNA adenosine(34) deaminase TadA [Legionella taurinensis]RJT48295.1 tRNA adenosine(34) deaminase TadA [Legionella taurinensis]
MGINDTHWMQKAYELALTAKQAGEVPVGAVLVDSNNQLLAAAGNRVITHNDPCAHAEILALREAAQKQANFRLLDTTLYVTLEPCAMCAGAMVHARIKRLVFAARDVKAGAAGSVYNLLKGYPLNHPVQIDEGFLEAECSALLKEFFMTRRS